LSGIPISSIERIEVLTDGASAIYGADALAGVINIILKRNYRGSQLTATYGNTFVSDTGYREHPAEHGL
jgi:iron complex outermembrane receptor protein